jgi:DNA-binding winged helix-turn-helix (wHTH) protein
MEYGILKLLYEQKGQSIPYADFSELWEDGIMSEASLQNFISRVRKALSIDPTVSIESTGKGYILNF